MELGTSLTTGIDAIEIDRVARSLDRFGERFLQRVYTVPEQRYCRARVERLAGRFAAKEAVSKALGTGIRALSWRDIEILPDERGKPTVHLYGRARAAAARATIAGMDVSITHSRQLALAYVVAWRVAS